jgi:hypothetical protein
MQRYAVWFGGSMLASSPEFYQAAHTKQEYMEKGPSICRHNPVRLKILCFNYSLFSGFWRSVLNIKTVYPNFVFIQYLLLTLMLSKNFGLAISFVVVSFVLFSSIAY